TTSRSSTGWCIGSSAGLRGPPSKRPASRRETLSVNPRLNPSRGFFGRHRAFRVETTRRPARRAVQTPNVNEVSRWCGLVRAGNKCGFMRGEPMLLRSIRSQLLGLVVATVVPFTALIGAGLWSQWRSDQAAAIQRASDEARLLAAQVDDHIGNLANLL